MSVPMPRGLLAAALVVALAAKSIAASAATPQGTWLTEGKDAAVTITSCGQRLCGRIIWLKSPTDQSGTLRRDQNNPDPRKRKAGLCGLVVIRDLRPAAPDRWEGSVYDPRNGKTYRGTVRVLSDTALNVRAYMALPIFGHAQTWTRAANSTATRQDDRCRAPGPP